MAQNQQEQKSRKGFNRADYHSAHENSKSLSGTINSSGEEKTSHTNFNRHTWTTPGGPNILNMVLHDTVIGYTFYDLQTDGSIKNAVVNNMNGTFSTVWNFSPNANTGFGIRCGLL